MAGEPDGPVLEILRKMQGTLAEMRADQREQRNRLASLERTAFQAERISSHILSELAEVRVELNTRLDRVKARLERLERRSELLDE